MWMKAKGSRLEAQGASEGSRLKAQGSSEGSRLKAQGASKDEGVREESLKEGGLRRPANWGGYRLIPDYYEFWQGRADRLHDRLVYKPDGEGWKIVRLAP
jgi:pyridoxamine 5'-phosphate oxidase